MTLPAFTIYRAPRVAVLSRPAFSEPEHLQVERTGNATASEQLIEAAGRLCYMSQQNPAGRETRDFVENLKKQGHGAALEHASFTLLIEGVSRALSHELVRHRAGFSYSQVSQRHADDAVAGFVVPPAIAGDASLEQLWSAQVELAQQAYVTMVEAVMGRYAWVGDKTLRRKLAREAASGVLPNSAETKLFVTANLRSWRTMLELRSGEDADLEMRRLAVMVLRVLRDEAPSVFSDFEIYAAADRTEAARVLYHKV